MPAISKPALSQLNNDSFPNNTAGEITPADLRNFNDSMITSLVDEIPFGTYTASVNTSISNLNTYTASQQPTYTALNSFTASQLTINTGVNNFTQSTNASINSLTAEVDTLQTWTGSVNAISDNGVLLGYSTRLNFYGLMTASIVANVGGPIAAIGLLSDTTRVSTSSFNAYTASTDSSLSNLNQFTSSQISFNTSATASIVALQSFSSSLDNTFATDAELSAVSASLVVSLNTKLNTSSFNSYTASTNTLLTGYATTGSNSFNGNQTITGSVTISGSSTNDLTVVGQIFVSSSATAAATAPKITVSGSAGTSTINRNSISTRNTTNLAQLSPAAVFMNVTATSDEIGFSVDTSATPNWSTGPSLYINNPTDTYPAVLGFQNKANYTDGRVTVLTRLIAQSGSVVSGSLTVTGSAYGNVFSASIVSSTASIDLSKANYFTLTIPSNTNINVTNAQPGVTATLVINTAGATSASFSSNVKQTSGSFYVPSNSGSIDILSFTAVTTSSVYVIPAYSFV